MTKVDIFSGFLGAGKTTLIKKLIAESYSGEKIVLIENEFGEIGIDGSFLKEAGIEITEMNSGCICCSLVGDFGEALKKVLEQFAPERIIIEPSGVGKLSDVISAVEKVNSPDLVLNSFTTVVDANKCKMYIKNFGEFFNNQVEHASAIVLSHTKNISDKKLSECVKLLREHNPKAELITTDWDEITGDKIVLALENKNTLAEAIEKLEEEHHHHHHHDDDDHECEHHHHHHDDDDHECEHHHHHDHDHECDDPDCCCHHHHHDADEVFQSWGVETTNKYSIEAIESSLKELENSEKYGMVLRAKGIVAGVDGKWIHFDYVPGEPDVRNGSAETIGKLCVIGSKINEKVLAELFGV